MISKKAMLRVSHEWSIYLTYLQQDQNVSIRSLCRTYPQLSLPTIWRLATKKIEVLSKPTKGKGGRKPKLNKRDKISIIRALHSARKQDGNFTSKESNFILLFPVFMTGLYAECLINMDVIIDRLDVRKC